MAKKPAGNAMISHGNVTENRRARHDYEIIETIETGIVLAGTEVKSLRLGRANIQDSYAGPVEGELFLFNAYIPEYGHAVKAFAHETRRPRKLLVRRRELGKLFGSVTREGMTLVPLVLYFNNRGMAKVKLGIAKGRKTHDKRHAIKEREWNRDKARLMRERG
ncbi:MAG: SsrA-binding protein SmpB [Rhodospirillaceae bacterium]